ncbi:MAG: 23S rRNA pseudouridine synthase F [Crocinitomicaceae bacterium]|nr:23S rRNA pseudouridine synthase F [Crocinitomicaceae bacterium]|tara:strand:- start:68759 stop:69490 length:732 start_codon:yes stop_codon:yes gene_type:complete
MKLKRLNKAISETGFCSRRDADRLIEKGKVRVNGEIATLGERVRPEDSIKINNKLITKKSNKIYLAFNKPKGITCTTDTLIKSNIVSYINYPDRIFPIGRLDKPSEGLIFLTNDGDIVNKILRAKNNHEKEYIVNVDKMINSSFIKKMEDGVEILNTKTLPCRIKKIDNNTFKIILTQGLNRQIRRMCHALGYEVLKLKRIRIMNIKLGDLKLGEYRHFTNGELERILMLIKNSCKTEEASNI